MNTHRGDRPTGSCWMQEAFGLTAADRVLQKTPFSFDVSVWEFFWPLLFGAELVIAEPGGHRDSTLPRAGHRRSRDHHDPLRALDAAAVPGGPAGRRLHRPARGSSAAARRCPRRSRTDSSSGSPAELHNLYGPTEAAVDVTWWACDPAQRPGVRPHRQADREHPDPHRRCGPAPCAGRNRRGAVHRRRPGRPRLPQPAGADGRAVRPGPVLAGRRRPAVPDRRPGPVHAGRQHRVPGPERLPGQDQGLPRGARRDRGGPGGDPGHPPGRRRGEGAVERRSRARRLRPVPRRRGTGEGRGSACQLLARLPEYMVPTTFVVLDRFPQTRAARSTGRRCPLRAVHARRSARRSCAPRTPLELRIADAWQRVLDVESVGVHDRFFELGGTSLQAARFVNEMQTELGETIFAVTLFGAPSIAEYAAFLQADYPAAVARLVGGDPPPIPRAPSRRAHHRGGRRPASGCGAHAPRGRPGHRRPEPAGDLHPEPAALWDHAPADHAGRPPRPVLGERAPAAGLLDAAGAGGGLHRDVQRHGSTGPSGP